MNSSIVNNDLQLTYPDDFHILSSEEMKEKFSSAVPDQWGIGNSEGNILIVVLSKKINALLAALADPKATVKKTQSAMEKLLKNNNYVFHDYFVCSTKSGEAYGFSYEYQSKGETKCARTVVLKSKHYMYTLNYYYGKENAKTAEDTFDTVTAALTFK